MTSLLDDVNNLLELNMGDKGRLEHIKETLEQNKVLYTSDREYLQNLTEKYLKEKIDDKQDRNSPNDYSSSNFQDDESSDSKTQFSNKFESSCNECGNKMSGGSFCPNCGSTQISKQSKSFCINCGLELQANSRYCPKCGTQQTSNQSINIQYQKITKKKLSKKKKIGISFGIILLFFGLLMAIPSDSSSNIPSNTKTVYWLETTPEIQQKILDRMEYSWDTLSYDELMRNNEKYVGKTISYRGEVLQVQNVYDDNYYALVFSKCESIFGYFFCSDDLIWINYSNVKILEGDFIGYWGDVKGLKNYLSGFGTSQTVPEVDVSAIHISIKKGVR